MTFSANSTDDDDGDDEEVQTPGDRNFLVLAGEPLKQSSSFFYRQQEALSVQRDMETTAILPLGIRTIPREASSLQL